MPSIDLQGIRRHGQGWQYRWTPPGVGKRETSPVFDNIEDAKQFKRWAENNRGKRVLGNDLDIEEGRWRFAPIASAEGVKTFREHAVDYLNGQKAEARSVKNYRNSVARVESVHNVLLQDLDEDALDALEKELTSLRKLKKIDGEYVETNAPRYAPSTLQSTMVTVRAVIRDAVKSGIIPRDPSPDYELTIGSDRLREHRYLTPDEYIGLRDCAESDVVRLMMDLMAYAGLRLGELIGLRVSRLHLDGPRPYIRVDQQVRPDGTPDLPKGTHKDGEKRKRNVRVHEGLAKDLAAYLEIRGRQASDWLFPSPMDPERPVTHNWGSGKNSPWARAVGKADSRGVLRKLSGLPTPHDLRHSHASWLFEKNVPIIKVSKRLGHKNIIVTATIYAHVLDLLDDESSDVMEATFSEEIIGRLFGAGPAVPPRLALVR